MVETWVYGVAIVVVLALAVIIWLIKKKKGEAPVEAAPEQPATGEAPAEPEQPEQPAEQPAEEKPQ